MSHQRVTRRVRSRMPTFEGDETAHPGYSLWGHLYALGYMKGLIEGVEKTR